MGGLKISKVIWAHGMLPIRHLGAVPPGITPGGTVSANFVYWGVGRQSYWNHEIRIPGILPTNKFKPKFPLYC